LKEECNSSHDGSLDSTMCERLEIVIEIRYECLSVFSLAFTLSLSCIWQRANKVWATSSEDQKQEEELRKIRKHSCPPSFSSQLGEILKHCPTPIILENQSRSKLRSRGCQTMTHGRFASISIVGCIGSQALVRSVDASTRRNTVVTTDQIVVFCCILR
jgi:hypothetical protein